MTKIEELTKRVAELEAEVARLKAVPAQFHYHYYQTMPVYQPIPPIQPQPWSPLWPTITYGNNAAQAA